MTPKQVEAISPDKEIRVFTRASSRDISRIYQPGRSAAAAVAVATPPMAAH